MLSSRKEIKAHVLSATRQVDSQIGTLINDFINTTISQIQNPAWAFRKPADHVWSFLRQKTSITTVASTESYVLPREIDRIGLVRQTTTPVKLIQLTDENFYKAVPNPTETGNPRFYRLWDIDGVSTRLTADDTIDVVSSSTSDSGSSELSISISGYDTNGIWRTETYKLNGTTTVAGSVTFDGNRPVYVQKQKNTTGSITITENSGGTTLVILGPKERAPKFKIIYFYPIPSSAITIDIEYYTRIPLLNNDSDVLSFDEKWHYVVVLGTLAKVYGIYLKDPVLGPLYEDRFSKAVESMVLADRNDTDLITHLAQRNNNRNFIRVKRSEDTVS